VLGLYEGVLLYSRPRYSPVARPDLGPLVILAAPLVDALLFGLMGLLGGCVARMCHAAGRPCARHLAAAGLGAVGAFAGGVTFLRFGWDTFPHLPVLILVVMASGVGVALGFTHLLRRREQRRGPLTPQGARAAIRRLRLTAAGVAGLLLTTVALYEIRASAAVPAPGANPPNFSPQPNIVLIAIDTAAAGHFSAYGYARPTTPHIDRWARTGVQFDNAISPSSWTLPAFASILTGLYPHQHGANYLSPLSTADPTLATLLKTAGYQTAGFNANSSYGQASQGIGRGFDLYQDGSENLRQNLAETFLGRALTKYVYLPWLASERPERQPAAEINHKVLRWFAHRSPQPYFLFINYFDAHTPYRAPRAYLNRFGGLPAGKAHPLPGTIMGAKLADVSPEVRAAAVETYDDALAYTDEQIDELLQTLAKSPDWPNTVVIITSDHGEQFGEHGAFGHGMQLWRELVHVPLVIFGAGIPSGMHVPTVVGTRRIFASILGLAGINRQGALRAASLQAYWSDPRGGAAFSPPVLSELGASPVIPAVQNTFLAVTTPKWQLILDAHGHAQLFDWTKDPQEQYPLPESPDIVKETADLERAARQRVADTAGQPGIGADYLQPLGLGVHAHIAAPDDDLLNSLPYQ
jgi:arylsulfatase A-like enzyme/uncharacterized membrane protein YeaQ/YmgE (transglycosylase-associated protein family)